MPRLTESEKKELKAKIGYERARKHQKERELIAYKHRHRKKSLGQDWGNSIITSGLTNDYRRELRQAKLERASNHIVDKDEPLRRIKLTEQQKEALRRKIIKE